LAEDIVPEQDRGPAVHVGEWVGAKHADDDLHARWEGGAVSKLGTRFTCGVQMPVAFTELNSRENTCKTTIVPEDERVVEVWDLGSDHERSISSPVHP
jgi:hypothetical protein